MIFLFQIEWTRDHKISNFRSKDRKSVKLFRRCFTQFFFTDVSEKFERKISLRSKFDRRFLFSITRKAKKVILSELWASLMSIVILSISLTSVFSSKWKQSKGKSVFPSFRSKWLVKNFNGTSLIKSHSFTTNFVRPTANRAAKFVEISNDEKEKHFSRLDNARILSKEKVSLDVQTGRNSVGNLDDQNRTNATFQWKRFVDRRSTQIERKPNCFSRSERLFMREKLSDTLTERIFQITEIM